MDEVRALWEVKRLVFGDGARCRTLDLTTQKKKCPELLTCVNTPWTDTHTHTHTRAAELPLPEPHGVCEEITASRTAAVTLRLGLSAKLTLTGHDLSTTRRNGSNFRQTMEFLL